MPAHPLAREAAPVARVVARSDRSCCLRVTLIGSAVMALVAAAALPGCYRRVTQADGFARFGRPKIYEPSDAGQPLTNRLFGPARTREGGGTMRAWSKTEPYRFNPDQRSVTVDEINDR